MVRLGKLTDYGLVLMTCIARSEASLPLRTARDLAAESELPRLDGQQAPEGALQSGLLISHRGIKGGYMLARAAARNFRDRNHRGHRRPHGAHRMQHGRYGAVRSGATCPIKSNQRIINQAVRGVLEKITLSDLIQPMQLTSIKDARGKLVPTIDSSGRIQ